MKVIYQLFILLFFTIACNGREIKDLSENNVLKTNKLFGEVKTEKEQHYNHIPFLQQIKETKNYQVVEIMKGGEPLWDSINKEFIIKGGIYFKYDKGGIFKVSMNRYSLFDLNDSFTYRGDQYNF